VVHVEHVLAGLCLHKQKYDILLIMIKMGITRPQEVLFFITGSCYKYRQQKSIDFFYGVYFFSISVINFCENLNSNVGAMKQVTLTAKKWHKMLFQVIRSHFKGGQSRREV
jgi:hypothetical protein